MSKIAVITGGTGGLGQTVCQAFLAAEYRVITTYRHDHELRDLLHKTSDSKERLEAVRIDVTNESSLDELVERIRKQEGHIDSLICLVGGFTAGTFNQGASQIFEAMMTLNAKSFLLTVQAMLPLLRHPKKEKAHVSHIIAIAARPALEPIKGVANYAASKAALVSLVQSYALELQADAITVNALAPSIIDTPANRKSLPQSDYSRWIKPQVIAKTLLFLCQNDEISGTIIPIYGKV